MSFFPHKDGDEFEFGKPITILQNGLGDMVYFQVLRYLISRRLAVISVTFVAWTFLFSIRCLSHSPVAPFTNMV